MSADLNAMLANIVECDGEVKSAADLVAEANKYLALAKSNLAAAQTAFDAAVLAVRGPYPGGVLADYAAPPAPAAAADEDPAEIFPAEGPIPMGPLPPTSPARAGMLPIAADTDPDDDREDQVYDDPGKQ